MLYHFYIPTNSECGFQFLHFLPTFVITYLFDYSHHSVMKWHLIVVLIFISLVAKIVEQLFMCLFVFPTSFLLKCLFKSVLFNQIFFLLLSFCFVLFCFCWGRFALSKHLLPIFCELPLQHGHWQMSGVGPSPGTKAGSPKWSAPNLTTRKPGLTPIIEF